MGVIIPGNGVSKYDINAAEVVVTERLAPFEECLETEPYKSYLSDREVGYLQAHVLVWDLAHSVSDQIN